MKSFTSFNPFLIGRTGKRIRFYKKYFQENDFSVLSKNKICETAVILSVTLMEF